MAILDHSPGGTGKGSLSGNCPWGGGSGASAEVTGLAASLAGLCLCLGLGLGKPEQKSRVVSEATLGAI